MTKIFQVRRKNSSPLYPNKFLTLKDINYSTEEKKYA